jgi:hypothetical protein
MFGFKFIIPHLFPRTCPFVFLDERPHPLYSEFFDYIKPGNILDFAFLHEWRSSQPNLPQKFTLQNTLIHVNTLYSQAPPDISGIAPEEPQPQSQAQARQEPRAVKKETVEDDPFSFILD